MFIKHMKQERYIRFALVGFTILCLLFTGLFGAFETAALYGSDCSAGALPEPDCDGVYIYEMNTDSVLYTKNADQKMYPASTTKLMTALLTAEYLESGAGQLTDVIVFSEAAVNGISIDVMHIGISVGEKLTVEDVLYGILLPSANEACLGMAEYVSGSIADFVDKMNARALELGMTGTHYVNPNGLHDDDHYTTASDMCLLMREVLKHELLLKIMSTATYTIPATNLSDARTLENTNKCIVPGSEYYNDKCICGKTGYTTPAANCLVTYSSVNGLDVIIVLLKAAKGVTFSATNRLLDYFEENVSVVKAESLIDFTASVPVAGSTAVIMAQPAVSFSIITHTGDDYNSFRKEYQMRDDLTLPVYAGDVMGTLALYDGDVRVANVSMVSRANYGDVTSESSSDSTELTSDSIVTTSGDKGQSDGDNGGGNTFVKVLLIVLGLLVVCGGAYGAILFVSLRRYNRTHKK